MANDKKIDEKVPPISELENRFHFIADDTLRQNVAIAFQYVIFLIAVLDEVGAEDSSIASSTHKDMITHTACVVEACTHHVLQKYIESGKVISSEVMPKEEKYLDEKELHRISENERILSVREVKRVERLNPRTQLVSLNRASLNADIFDRETFGFAEELREMRNKIHLAGLSAVDDAYSKSESNRAFELAKKIIDQIETKLEALAQEDVPF